MDTTFIYSLEYPKGNVRYIGKSDNPDVRFKSHLRRVKESASKKNSWILSILNAGHKPIMTILDEIPRNNWGFWERYYISLFKSWGFNLTNLTFGGDGCDLVQESKNKIGETLKVKYKNGEISVWNKGLIGVYSGTKSPNFGLTRSVEVKSKISEKKKEYFKTHNVWNKNVKGLFSGDKSPSYGKPRDNETKAKISEKKKEYFKRNTVWNKGKVMTDDFKNKMSEISQKKREVCQFTTDGVFIASFESLRKAMSILNVKGNISECCLNKSMSAHGFIWIYKDDLTDEVLNERVSLFRNKNEYRRHLKNTSKPLKQINPSNNEVIKTFPSIVDAVKSTGFTKISRHIGDGFIYKGFLWEFV